MIGQISESSRDLTKETEIGRESFTEEDRLKLPRGIVQTHMCGSRLGSDQNFHKSQLAQQPEPQNANFRERSTFYQKMKTSLSALKDSSESGDRRANTEDG